MRLLFNGDSFTEGQELGPNYKSLRYSAKVCKSLGIEEHNIGASGSSNERITRTTLEWINDNPIDALVICWSYPDRLMYTGKAPSPKDSQVPHFWKSTSVKRAEAYNHKPWINFYANIWTDEMMRNNFIMNNLIIQEFCKNRGIKLIMSHICPPSIYKGFTIDPLFSLINKLDEDGFVAPPGMDTGDGIHPNSIMHSKFAQKLLPRL